MLNVMILKIGKIKDSLETCQMPIDPDDEEEKLEQEEIDNLINGLYKETDDDIKKLRMNVYTLKNIIEHFSQN